MLLAGWWGVMSHATPFSSATNLIPSRVVSERATRCTNAMRGFSSYIVDCAHGSFSFGFGAVLAGSVFVLLCCFAINRVSPLFR